MSPNQETHGAECMLALLLRRGIMARTSGRMRELDVQVDLGRVIVRGVSSSYYVKQLAIQEVLKLLEHSEPLELDLDIRVDDQPTIAWHRSWSATSLPASAGNA